MNVRFSIISSCLLLISIPATYSIRLRLGESNELRPYPHSSEGLKSMKVGPINSISSNERFGTSNKRVFKRSEHSVKRRGFRDNSIHETSRRKPSRLRRSKTYSENVILEKKLRGTSAINFLDKELVDKHEFVKDPQDKIHPHEGAFSHDIDVLDGSEQRTHSSKKRMLYQIRNPLFDFFVPFGVRNWTLFNRYVFHGLRPEPAATEQSDQLLSHCKACRTQHLRSTQPPFYDESYDSQDRSCCTACRNCEHRKPSLKHSCDCIFHQPDYFLDSTSSEAPDDPIEPKEQDCRCSAKASQCCMTCCCGCNRRNRKCQCKKKVSSYTALKHSRKTSQCRRKREKLKQ